MAVWYGVTSLKAYVPLARERIAGLFPFFIHKQHSQPTAMSLYAMVNIKATN